MATRIHDLLKDYQIRKAAGALISEPPVLVDDRVVADMATKHPAARPSEADRLAELRPVAPAAAPIIAPDATLKAIRSFPRGSGGGPSGLKPRHLQDALIPGFEAEVTRQVTGVLNLLLRGEAPPAVRPWLTGASLAALPKPDVRPSVGWRPKSGSKEPRRPSGITSSPSKSGWARRGDARPRSTSPVNGWLGIEPTRTKSW